MGIADDRRRPLILVAVDDPAVRKLLVEVLEFEGYSRVITAVDGSRRYRYCAPARNGSLLCSRA